jgi:hypothetical protein
MHPDAGDDHRGDATRMEGGQYYVPKRDLITGVQVLLQAGGLRIAGGLKGGTALAAEMAEMRVRITAAGNTQYGCGVRVRMTT